MSKGDWKPDSYFLTISSPPDNTTCTRNVCKAKMIKRVHKRLNQFSRNPMQGLTKRLFLIDASSDRFLWGEAFDLSFVCTEKFNSPRSVA